jgi:NTE family protein
VSVGALNGVMLAMEKYARLFEVWNTISNDQVYTGGFNLWSGLKVLLFGATSFYGNQPLYRLLKQEYEPDKIRADLRVGMVSLITGEYVQYKPGMPGFAEAVLASTVMPIIWEPVDVTPELRAMVDGGVRNISPLGDVLADDPDEIVVINCGNEKFTPRPAPPKNILEIGLTTLDILESEVFRNDLREFLRINALVRQAEQQGLQLLDPKTGKPYKYYACKVIEPEIVMGDVLDFSQPVIQAQIAHGIERARAVLGE